MNKDLVIKKLKEYYALKELFSQKNVQEFVAREMKANQTNSYGYAKLLSVLQEYVREFEKIKVGDETIDQYVSRFTGSFKEMDSYKNGNYVTNPTKEGYDAFLYAAFDCFGKGKDAIKAIGMAFESDKDTRKLVSSLPIKVGGATRKSNTMLIVDNIAEVAVVSGLRGNVSELSTAKGKLDDRIEKLQIRLKDEMSKVQTLSDISKVNAKQLEDINGSLSNLFNLIKEEGEQIIGAVAGLTSEVQDQANQLRAAIENEGNKTRSEINKKRIGLCKKIAGAALAVLVVGTGAFFLGRYVSLDNASAIVSAYEDYEGYVKDETDQFTKFGYIMDRFADSKDDVTKEQVDSYLKTGKWESTTTLSAKPMSFDVSKNLDNISYEEIELGRQVVDEFSKTDRTDKVVVNGVTFDYSLATKTADMLNDLYSVENAKLSSDKSALESKVSSLNGDIGKLNKRVSELEEMLKNAGSDEELLAKINELNTTISELQGQVEVKNTEITRLKELLQDAENSKTITEQEKAELQSQLDQAEADLQTANDALEDANNRITQLQTENESLKAENADLKAQIESAKAQISELNNTLTAKIAELDSANATIEQRDATLSNLNSQITNLNSTITALESRYDELLADKDAQSAENQARIAELEKTLEAANLAKESAENKAAELETENATLRNQISELQTENAKLQKESADLSANYLALQKTFSKLENKNNQTEENLKKAQSDLATAQSALQSKINEYNELLERYNTLETKSSELAAQLVSTQEQLEQALATNQSITESVSTIYASIFGTTSSKTAQEMLNDIVKYLVNGQMPSTEPGQDEKQM